MEENTLMDLSELQKVLQEYARDAEELYRYQLSLGSKNASRSLAESARAEVVVNDDIYEVVLNLNEYWKFVERGRAGTLSSPSKAKTGSLPASVPKQTKDELRQPMSSAAFPPVSAIMKWISVKPVIPRPDKDGRIPSPKSLAFLIGRKIHEEGIEPHPALATTIQELDKIYHDKIVAALGRDVGAYVKRLM